MGVEGMMGEGEVAYPGQAGGDIVGDLPVHRADAGQSQGGADQQRAQIRVAVAVGSTNDATVLCRGPVADRQE